MQLIKKIIIFLLSKRILLKTKLSDGTLIYGLNKAGFGGRGVFIYGDSIEPELEKLNHFLDSGDVFIDVGANSGIYTLKAAKLVKKEGIVVAIEPSLAVLQTLSLSIKKNNFNNIRLRNFCAAGESQERTLWLNEGKPNIYSLSIRIGNPESISVIGISLDDLIKWEKLKRVNYLKIDAEGAENEILSGAKELINKFRPIIQTEEVAGQIKFPFESYTRFKATESLNIVLIPDESSKISIPAKLGWEKL